MTRSTVYVVQNTMRGDPSSGLLVPKYDLSPAEQYGRLVYLLGPSAKPWTPDSVLPELADKLRSFTEDDYLLLIGSPVLIGWAVALAADATGGVVQCLQWSGTERGYRPIRAELPSMDAVGNR